MSFHYQNSKYERMKQHSSLQKYICQVNRHSRFLMHYKFTEVNCGLHKAITCSGCPQFENWCGGDCIWIDGACAGK